MIVFRYLCPCGAGIGSMQLKCRSCKARPAVSELTMLMYQQRELRPWWAFWRGPRYEMTFVPDAE